MYVRDCDCGGCFCCGGGVCTELGSPEQAQEYLGETVGSFSEKLLGEANLQTAMCHHTLARSPTPPPNSTSPHCRWVGRTLQYSTVQ